MNKAESKERKAGYPHVNSKYFCRNINIKSLGSLYITFFFIILITFSSTIRTVTLSWCCYTFINMEKHFSIRHLLFKILYNTFIWYLFLIYYSYSFMHVSCLCSTDCKCHENKLFFEALKVSNLVVTELMPQESVS